MLTFRRKVQKGKQLGQTIGFPTLNVSVGSFQNHTFGVYACTVWIGKSSYRGALYFGPKIGSHQKAHLEIHVLDFNKKVYGEFVRFTVGKKIREPQGFKNVNDLKEQIQKDLLEIKIGSKKNPPTS